MDQPSLPETLCEHLVQAFAGNLRVVEKRTSNWKNSQVLPEWTEYIVFDVTTPLEEDVVLQQAAQFYWRRGFNYRIVAGGGIMLYPTRGSDDGFRLQVSATVLPDIIQISVE